MSGKSIRFRMVSLFSALVEAHPKVSQIGSTQSFRAIIDASVNGDRTTFDHTAGRFEFAFVGDLNLVVTTEEHPQGLSVTFYEVVVCTGKYAVQQQLVV